MKPKRLLKKTLLGGNIITGHIYDALEKKKKTGKNFRECLGESVKETFAEDLPGTSHLYQMGKNDGKVEGTIEQAERDEKKMQQMHEKHAKDRKRWEEIDNEKDALLEEMSKNDK